MGDTTARNEKIRLSTKSGAQWLGGRGQGATSPSGINFVGKIGKYVCLSENSENSNASKLQSSD